MSVTAIAVFCESIRHEVGGQVSLVGIFNDHVIVEAFPGAMSRLSIYARVVIDRASVSSSLSLALRFEGREDLLLSELDPEMISATLAESEARGAPYATLVIQIESAQFMVPEPCRLLAVLNKDGAESTIGHMRFSRKDDPA